MKTTIDIPRVSVSLKAVLLPCGYFALGVFVGSRHFSVWQCFVLGAVAGMSTAHTCRYIASIYIVDIVKAGLKVGITRSGEQS